MNWISVVILLVALSMVNASPFHIYKRDNLLHKRAVPIEACKEASTIPLEGSVDPDPEVGKAAKAKVSFVTTADVPKLFLTTTLLSDGADAATAKVTTADLCAADSGLTCPVPKGKEVTIESTTDIPADTKAPFTIEYNINDGETVISCGVAKAKAAEGAPKEAPKEAPKGDDAPKDAPKEGPKEAPKEAPKGGGDAPPDGGDGGDGPPDGGDGGDGPPDGGDGGDAPPDGPPEP